jgi:glutathione S-transferase
MENTSSHPALRLASHHLCPYVQRAVIVAAEKGVAVERRLVDLTAKPDWFNALSPTGKVPLLEAGAEVLFESAPIIEYLDEITPGSLHPSDPIARARHRAWIEFASATLNDIAGLYNAPDPAAFEAKRRRLAERFEEVEAAIRPGPWFEGDRFQMVDAVWGPVFRYFDVIDVVLDPGLFDGRPKVEAWRRALAARPSVRDAVERDYPARLLEFLRRRDSHLAKRLAAAA